ncbi:type II toxin-antitoxin system VapC family toxin [Georgenia sp. TF02-10]|uniref:type II toxin-antitoxin system VapC family toxin n=1 Tax=Georgenia sp. TF02-10 TaxID=2917725 RepID=UPI001FA74F68|nr:type II toxin-antitoxin system VapC family toxin [Georgenia sp. TF02-10]UNX56138.1 type II toxin-antitoxin system VapC family toxin [Georgenia sp. TF02-10]
MTAAASTPVQVVYLDTSAAVKLISDERESDGLRSYLDEGMAVVSSDLLETELRRIGMRHRIDQVLITAVLDGVTLTPLTRDQFRKAGLYPQVGLRSLDALHLAGALGIEAAAILTYDTRLAEAARANGLKVVAPE